MGAISKILFILGSYKFLAYLECIRSYAWSFGHSDPDLSSVMVLEIEQGWFFYLSKFNEYISQKEAKIRRPRPTSKLRLEYYLKIDPFGAKKVRTVYEWYFVTKIVLTTYCETKLF